MEPNNEDRAQWAFRGVREHYNLTHGNPDDQVFRPSTSDAPDAHREELQTALSDLLCDLRHLASIEDLDWDAADSNGQGHWFEENQEEEDAKAQGQAAEDPEPLPPPVPAVRPCVNDRWCGAPVGTHEADCPLAGTTD